MTEMHFFIGLYPGSERQLGVQIQTRRARSGVRAVTTLENLAGTFPGHSGYPEHKELLACIELISTP